MQYTGDVYFTVEFNLKELYIVLRMKHVIRKQISEMYAKHYWQWLKRRYIRLSQGAGEWPELEESTIKRKEARQKTHGYSGDPYWKLSESGTLFHELRYKVNIKGAQVGYISNSLHPTNAGTKGQISVGRLVSLHQVGTSSMPARPIMELPPSNVLATIKRNVQQKLGRIIKGQEK